MIKCKLSPLALGLAFGILWGISIFLMGLLAHFFSYGEVFVTSIGTLYIGYDTTIIGSIIGGIIGFVDGFIGAAILAWLYNFFAGCCKKEDEWEKKPN